MMRWLQNEKGNITLLTLGVLSVMVLMFAVLLNLVKVFAVKQQASSVAEQASLSATAEIYRVITDAIQAEDAEGLLGTGVPIPLQKSLAEQIEDKKTQLNSQHPSWSHREIYTEAVDQVLVDTLPDPQYSRLKSRIEDALNNSVPQIQQTVTNTITSNGGVLDGTEIKINSQLRFEVKTSSLYKAYQYDSFIPEEKRKIYQVGTGPELLFLKYVNWSI